MRMFQKALKFPIQEFPAEMSWGWPPAPAPGLAVGVQMGSPCLSGLHDPAPCVGGAAGWPHGMSAAAQSNGQFSA